MGYGLHFSLKTCRLQNPRLDSHNLHRFNSPIWFLFQTFQLLDLMTQCAPVVAAQLYPVCLCAIMSYSSFLSTCVCVF